MLVGYHHQSFANMLPNGATSGASRQACARVCWCGCQEREKEWRKRRCRGILGDVMSDSSSVSAYEKSGWSDARKKSFCRWEKIEAWTLFLWPLRCFHVRRPVRMKEIWSCQLSCYSGLAPGCNAHDSMGIARYSHGVGVRCERIHLPVSASL